MNYTGIYAILNDLNGDAYVGASARVSNRINSHFYGPQMKKRMSGGARVAASGKSPVALSLTPEEKDIAQKAAKAEGRSLANLFLFHGMKAAKIILGGK